MVKSPLWRQSGLVSADERVWIEPGSWAWRRRAADQEGGCRGSRNQCRMPSSAQSPHTGARLLPGPRPLRRGGAVRARRRVGGSTAQGRRDASWDGSASPDRGPEHPPEVPARTTGESTYLPPTLPLRHLWSSLPALRASETRPAPSRSASVDPPVRRVQAAPGEVQPTPFTPGVLQPGAGGALMSETVPSVGGQSIACRQPCTEP